MKFIYCVQIRLKPEHEEIILNREKTKRQLQAIKTRDKIYASAIRLFYIKGYDFVTIEEICSEAGVSKGLFYNYFASKDEVLFSEFHKFEDVYREVRKSFLPDETSAERLLACTEKMILYILNNELKKAALRIVYMDALKQPNGILMNKEREFYSIIKEIIAYGQQRGEIRTDLTIEELKNYIASHLFGCYFLWIANDKFDILKEMKNHIAMIMNGIRAATQKQII